MASPTLKAFHEAKLLAAVPWIIACYKAALAHPKVASWVRGNDSTLWSSADTAAMQLKLKGEVAAGTKNIEQASEWIASQEHHPMHATVKGWLGVRLVMHVHKKQSRGVPTFDSIGEITSLFVEECGNHGISLEGIPFGVVAKHSDADTTKGKAATSRQKGHIVHSLVEYEGGKVDARELAEKGI